MGELEINAPRRYRNLPLTDRCKDGRLYQVNNRTRNGTIYLRCHNTTFCFGTAKYENNRLTHANPHSEYCMPDERSALIGDFKKALKDSLTNHWYKLRDLYDQTSLVYPEAAALVTFKSIRSFMMRCRRIVYPPRPTNLLEFSEQLNNQENARMLEYNTGRLATKLVVDPGENKHLIIYDAEFIRTEIMRDVTKLFVDATFRSTPNLQDAYQLLTVMGIKFNHGIPLIWVIMSRKLQSSYVTVFEYIKEHILPEARIDVIMSDFEAALRNACYLTFPQVYCAGCNTHYDRALLQNMKLLGLRTLIRADEDARLLVKKLMALAYLPADMIEHQYFYIKNDLSVNLKRRFSRFFAYWERYWLRIVTPAGFSVFGLSRRTNNISESYNARLGRNLQAKPSPWDFISKLLSLQNHAKCDVERLKRNSGGITRHARYQTSYKNHQLQKAWRELHFRQITVDEFIIKATYLKGDIAHQIARECNRRNGEEFELTETPRRLPLENDPDYDQYVFRGIFPGPFMRDNAEGHAVHRHAAVAEHDPIPEELGEHDNVIAAPPVLVPERPQTPEEESDAEINSPAASPVSSPERPQTSEDESDAEINSPAASPVPSPERPQTSEDELDAAIHLPATPPAVLALTPERPLTPEDAAHAEVNLLDALVPEREPPIPEEGRLPVVLPARQVEGSRRSRRRKRQRQRRRNATNIPNGRAADSVRDPRPKRRRGNEEEPKLCIVCLTAMMTHAFLPCGHRVCCEDCSRRIYYDEDLRSCPACRVALGRSPVRIFV